jgi:DNA (cytosine-5)-methyltransferase 1
VSAYYNEIDPFSAAWLRELIKSKLIADGEVDERSIEDVTANDLRGFTQCHFFAGIGVWSHALRCAGWPDDRPVWTGSCPCQSFSAAGKGKGFDDERHLWPAWFHLIEICRPSVVFGEQVEAAVRKGWLDLVSDDLEGIGYTCGAVAFPACSIGAPHIRQRLYFVADASESERRGRAEPERHEQRGILHVADRSASFSVADTNGRNACAEREQRSGEQRLQPEGGGSGELALSESIGSGTGLRDREPGEIWRIQPSDGCGNDLVGDAINERLEGHGGNEPNGNEPGRIGEDTAGSITEAGVPCNGFWSDAIFIPCRDGKARPVKPGIFPLAHGYPNRVGILRGAGNAIVAPQATEFIKIAMEYLTGRVK